MTQYLSEKLRALSAIAIILVIYIHMYYIEGAQYQSLKILQKAVGGGLCLVAVPLFYVISGYLFFVKVPFGIQSISKKIKKRVKTLAIPYIPANILTFLFWLILGLIAYKVVAIDRVINYKILNEISEQNICG